MDQVEIKAYDQNYPLLYKKEVKALKKLFPKGVSFHHIGSTAVKGLVARPLVDILAVAKTIEEDALTSLLAGEGYVRLPGEKLCFEKEGFTLTFLLQSETKEFERLIAFRDYLRAQAEDAAAYGKVKEELAAVYADDLEGYLAARGERMKELEEKALAYRKKANHQSLCMALGMCLGISLGMSVGSMLGNTSLGMCVGVSIGVAAGALIGTRKSK